MRPTVENSICFQSGKDVFKILEKSIFFLLLMRCSKIDNHNMRKQFRSLNVKCSEHSTCPALPLPRGLVLSLSPKSIFMVLSLNVLFNLIKIRTHSCCHLNLAKYRGTIDKLGSTQTIPVITYFNKQ